MGGFWDKLTVHKPPPESSASIRIENTQARDIIGGDQINIGFTQADFEKSLRLRLDELTRDLNEGHTKDIKIQSMEDFTTTDPLLRRTLMIGEKTLGPEHLQTKQAIEAYLFTKAFLSVKTELERRKQLAPAQVRGRF